MLLRKICAICLPLTAMLMPAVAEDWPHWMGPTRDNVWHEEGLIEKFPEGGPPIAWRTEVAGGYAGPAVADGKVFVADYVTADEVKIANFERKDSTGVERVLCLDEATGKEIWRHEYPVIYTISYPAGPRCTPTVDADKVYTLGAEGDLLCLDVNTGKVLWSKNFPNDYGAKTSLWGYSSFPLVDGEKLICVVGGEGSHAVAFDKNTGEEIWRALTSTDQGYAPPTIIEAAGVRQLILLCPDKVASVDPETGKEYWTAPYDSNNGLVSMSPIVVDDHMFIGGYDKKNLLLKLAEDKPGAEVVWGNESKKAMSPVNVQPFLDGNIMYGVGQRGVFMAVDLPSGERLWETSKPISERPVNHGTAFVVRQGDRYWLFNENGELIIARLTPEGYEEIDRAKIIEPTNNAFGRKVVWCMPAFANHKLFVRNDDECICVDLAAN